MPRMKRRVQMHMTVEFDADEMPSQDIDEALEAAVKNTQRLLGILPPLRGASSRGRQVSFTVKDLELAQ